MVWGVRPTWIRGSPALSLDAEGCARCGPGVYVVFCLHAPARPVASHIPFTVVMFQHSHTQLDCMDMNNSRIIAAVMIDECHYANEE